MDDDRASARWLMRTMNEEIDDAGQLTWRPKIMLGSTMRVDGRLDASTAFRAEAKFSMPATSLELCSPDHLLWDIYLIHRDLYISSFLFISIPMQHIVTEIRNMTGKSFYFYNT